MVRGHDGAILIATLGQGVVAYRDGRIRRPDRARDADAGFVRDLDCRDAATATSGSARATPACCASQDRSRRTLTEGLPDPKVNCLLPDEDGALWIGTDQGVVALARQRGHARPACRRALQTLPALGDDPRSRVEHLDRGRRRGLLRVNRAWRLALEQARPRDFARQRDHALRGSRRQSLGRHRSRYRAMARRACSPATRPRRVCRRIASARSSSTPHGARGSRRPTGGLYWLRRTVSSTRHGGRARPTTSSIRSAATATTLGGTAARRAHAPAARGTGLAVEQLHPGQRAGAGQRLRRAPRARRRGVGGHAERRRRAASRTACSRPTTRPTAWRRTPSPRFSKAPTARCGSARRTA